ncbi:hypothetical protein D3C86_2041000 [compost metagenome]
MLVLAFKVSLVVSLYLKNSSGFIMVGLRWFDEVPFTSILPFTRATIVVPLRSLMLNSVPNTATVKFLVYAEKGFPCFTLK